MKMQLLTVPVAVAALLVVPALAGPVHVDKVVNFSSENPSGDNRTFLTESTMSPVTGGDGFYSFTHRMAVFNERFAKGGVAQTNKRNVNFRFNFTVADPGNVGYTINLESLLRGVSFIDQTVAGTDTAFATGIKLDVRYGVNLDDPSDGSQYTVVSTPMFGMDTPNVSVVGVGSNAGFGEEYQTALLPGCVSHTGTKTFSLRVITTTTPTTNVLFQNNTQGMGFVNYGLGKDFAGFDVNPNDLGHFFTVNVIFGCSADLNCDGFVDALDLLILLGAWGKCNDPDECPADLNSDGVVDALDLLVLLGAWGPCPGSG